METHMVSSRLQQRTSGRFIRSECGQSLVLAMIVMSALTISIGALISLTTGNEHQFGRDRESARAFHVAEAGVNNGLSLIVTNDDQDSASPGTHLGPYPFALDGAAGTYSLTKYAKTDAKCQQQAATVASCWVISGSATSPNGTITRTITETAYWLAASSNNPTNANYGLVVDNQGAACVDTHGTVNFTIKDVWISGDFCPSGNVSLIPPAAHTGSVYIGGVYQGTNNTSVGTSSLPYANIDIVGGCTVQGSPQICSDSANSNVWSDGPPSVDPSDFELPIIDTPGTYAKGNWNSPQCSGGSFTFDSDTTANGTTPTTSLFSGPSFNCTVNDSGGNPVGHLKWDNTTKQLSISGTVWIDGNVDLSNSGTYVQDNVVTGSNGGTIFINGTVDGSSNITVCGPIGSAVPSGYGCPGTWDPNLGILGLVIVNPSNQGTAFDRTGNGELDLEVLINQGYANTGGTTVMAPVMADTATMGGNGGSVVPTAPPSGFPSVNVSQATWVVTPGSWAQTQ
jgi:Tfp pilus assembly protein PilX